MAPQAEQSSGEHTCHPSCQESDPGSERVNPPVTMEQPDKPAASWIRLSRTSVTRASSSNSRTVHLVKRSPAALRREKSNTGLARSRGRGKDSVHMSKAKPLPSLPENLATPSKPGQVVDGAPVYDPAANPPSSEEELLKSCPPDLLKLINQLRVENKALKEAKTPPRSSSLSSKGSNPMISVSKEELDLLRSQSSTINNEIIRLEARVAEAEKREKRTMKELALATRTEANSFDDKHFEDEVKKLRFDVSNWTRNQEWKIASDKDNFQENIARYSFLKTTCPSFMDYIFDVFYITDLIEAHLWQFFVRRIFGHYVWTIEQRSAPPGQEKRTHNPHREWRNFIEENLDESQSLQLLEDWRVASARVLAAFRPPARKLSITLALKKLRSEIVDGLKPISHANLDIKTLEDIIRGAIMLDITMQQQRPLYTFDPILEKDSSMTFKQSLMELVNSDDQDSQLAEGKQVSLILKPGFWKYGNSAGRNYEQRIVLLKAVADVFN